jgi:uncharacterized protein (TIGR02453 family)
MAYSEDLAARIRGALGDRSDVVEKKMFGGLAFMVAGKMACGIVKDDLMARVGDDRYEDALARPHARVMDFTGRPMRGFVLVGADGLRTAASLRKWIGEALDFAAADPKGTTKTGFSGFPNGTLDFLRGLAKNNKKAWFEAHREEYETFYVETAKAFVSAIGPRLQKISKTVHYEPRVNGSIFRINRDVRFSKDKTPYKPHLDLWFWEGDDRGWETPGFFFRLEPTKLILGAGMHQFSKEKLERYRKAVVDDRAGRALVKLKNELERDGCKIGGVARKTVPRGFDPAHPRASFLLHEGLHATFESAVPRTIKTPAFVDECVERYKAAAPISKWLSEHVTR